MKPLSAKANIKGLTLFEVLVVLAVLFILAAMLLPALVDRNHKGGNSVRCLSNQRQIGLGFIMWNSDNKDQFPWQISITNGGALEAAKRGYAAANFLCLSNYLRMTTVFVCRSDTNRTEAANFAQFNNLNVSYFVSFDAATNAADSILTGDRHLANNGKPVKTGLFVHSSGSKMSWTRELHNANSQMALGIFAFEDGHAQVIKDRDLDSFFLRENLVTNRLAVP